jgi:hypothetical protein
MSKVIEILNKGIDRESQDSLRQQLIPAIRDAAQADNVFIYADGLALLSQPSLMFVNAPIAGIEKIDFKAMLDGRPVLDDISVMYWHLSGGGFDEKNSSIPAGFYTVVAHEQRGVVSLRNAKGRMVAEGNLNIGIGPVPPIGTEEIKISGGIDEFKLGKGHLKLCGNVDVEVGPVTVKISGCIEATW